MDVRWRRFKWAYCDGVRLSRNNKYLVTLGMGMCTYLYERELHFQKCYSTYDKYTQPDLFMSNVDRRKSNIE